MLSRQTKPWIELGHRRGLRIFWEAFLMKAAAHSKKSKEAIEGVARLLRS